MGVIAPLPPELSRLYYDAILTALSEADRHVLEAHMQRYEYQSDFARRYVAQGREEGREEGLEEGQLLALRSAALALARGKLGGLRAEDVAAIEALCDPAALSRLILELGLAPDPAHAREILQQLPAPVR